MKSKIFTTAGLASAVRLLHSYETCVCHGSLSFGGPCEEMDMHHTGVFHYLGQGLQLALNLSFHK